MTTRTKMSVAVAAACGTATMGVLGAQAVAAEGDGTTKEGRAVVDRAASSLPSFTDEQLVAFLVAGEGPVAAKHPDLLRTLGFDEDRPATPQASLDAFTRDYLAADPDFHATVARPLASGDPAAVDGALAQFSRELGAVVEPRLEKAAQKQGRTVQEQAKAAGWTWQGANIAVYANAVAVANAGVYANVGVATFVGAVLAVWYLEDGSMTGTRMEREAFVADLSDALSR